MRIYGGHDYYDSALSLGSDPAIILVRKKEDLIPVEKLNGTLILDDLRLYGYPSTIMRHITVMFAGTLHFGVKIEGFKPLYMWSARSMKDWLARHKGIELRFSTRWIGRRGRELPGSLEHYFEPKALTGTLRDLCINERWAILVEEETNRGDGRRILLNPPILKGMEFAKVVDPFTAFQELSMWVGGILCGSSPAIVAITDDLVLAQSHGFDKQSFRGPRIR